MKRISDAYLYQMTDYGKEIFNYLMNAHRVDKSVSGFSDIVYEVKRQAAASILMKVLLSDKVVLLIDSKGMSRAFKVMYHKDPKIGKSVKRKVFIDCTGIIKYENGVYTCTKVSTLISYLFAAMTYIIYENMPKAIISNNTIMKSGTGAFVDLMLYILSYLKVPVTDADNKEKMSFVLAEYYQVCVVGRENGEMVYNLAKSVSGITEKKTCDHYHILFNSTLTPECNFNIFLAKFAEVFLGQKEGAVTPKNRAKLTTDSFAQRWMTSYGPSTFLGLEVFVPFSQMLTDVYIGGYLNQQNTIEKVVGGKTIVKFANELLKVGSENA
jgi:hypothetical protein